ncbi:PH domain-containing protein [Mycolicibacterium fallax]|nr:PH domain-containing protein [Mycolicibacterium fallax]HOW94812.1 PH domain-containing protein [Mycolicibacterium fallax]HSA40519.1 PH domain-containing protein [Mycobacterium sp.]
MAHLAVGFMVLVMLVPVLAWPWLSPLLLLAVLASVAIARLRTEADADGVTARTLLGSTRLDWADIDGLHFVKGNWARARLRDGTDVRLPAVTFATLPLLTEASHGRVPNPYR